MSRKNGADSGRITDAHRCYAIEKKRNQRRHPAAISLFCIIVPIYVCAAAHALHRQFQKILNIEAEQDDIAIFDNVIFSFQTNQTFLFGLCVSTAV